MGRPEAPLDARDGPLREFAAGLRQLRESSGGRSYRQLAKSANFAASTLARAASGRSLPSWEVTAAYVGACGGDLTAWRGAWADAARHASRAQDPQGAPQQQAPPSPVVPVRQLPADLHDFIGRQAECELLLRAARTVELGSDADPGAPLVVVVCGPGGVGKSTLAVHAAHRVAAGFPDGQLFADLHGDDDQPAPPAQVAGRFLAALGGAADRFADPVASFRSLAAGRRLLVLLDNAADEAQVAPLLPGSAGCLVLVTSRQSLGALGSACALRLDVFDHDCAVELLAHAAGPAHTADTAATAALAEMCGRLPLALRIAGSRLASGPAGRAGWLVERLRGEEHRLRHLATGDLDLSAVFGLSYRPLAPAPRQVFRSAGLFPGPDFTAPALAVLADMTTIEVECALERLVDASLAQPAQPGRYRMHDLLRLFARERAELEGDAERLGPAVRRLALWYLDAIDSADRMLMPARGRPAPLPGTSAWPDVPDMTDTESASAWYEAEQANLVAVTRAAARYGHHDIAWRLPVAMRGLLELRGHTEEWIAVHLAGLESAHAANDPAAQAWVLNGLGTAYWRREHHAEAVDCYRRALAIRTELGDDRGVAVVLNNLGSVYGAQGRYGDAVESLREALAIREKIGDELDKSFALNNLGHVQHELGLFGEALPLLTEALRIRRALGNRNGEAVTLHCLGDTLNGLGRHLAALACLRQALPVFRQLGNRYGEAATLHSIGSACAAMARPGHAQRYLGRAIALYQELGLRREEEAAARDLAAACRDGR